MVTNVTGSQMENSVSPSLFSPPYCTGTCSGAIYLFSHPIQTRHRKHTCYREKYDQRQLDKGKNETNLTHLKRVSADFDGPANTNLLFVLWVRKGLIILLKAKYHHGTLIKIFGQIPKHDSDSHQSRWFNLISFNAKHHHRTFKLKNFHKNRSLILTRNHTIQLNFPKN